MNHLLSHYAPATPCTNTRRAFFCLLVFVAYALAGGSCIRADDLPQWNIEDEVFKSEVVIAATVIQNNTVEIKEVLMGPMRVGQKLQVERFLDLSRSKFDSENAADYFPYGNAASRKAPPPDVQGSLMLFLSKNQQGRWETEGWGSGVKWLSDGDVFGYRQFTNPGDYFLVPDRDCKTEAQLRDSIAAAIAKKLKLTAAGKEGNPKRRIERLAEFLQPDSKSFWYFEAALRGIKDAGPVAGPFLREQAERTEQKPHRFSFLMAYAYCGDSKAVPYFLNLVKRATPLLKNNIPYHYTALTPAERDIMNDWSIGIGVLADKKDKRALPELREAVRWGAINWTENRILESAARGLQQLPHPDNIPVLAQALTSIPSNEYDWVAVESCLRALAAHHDPATIPALAGQLKLPEHSKSGSNPREDNVRLAHQSLIDLVGRDLGKDPGPWIERWKAKYSHNK